MSLQRSETNVNLLQRVRNSGVFVYDIYLLVYLIVNQYLFSPIKVLRQKWRLFSAK